MNIEKMAEAISNARKSGQQCELVWPDPAPSMEDAIKVQEAVFDAYGQPNAGWKVGATNDGAQQVFGLDGPFFGPMAASGVQEDGVEIKKTATVMAVEPEYAFKMARDFPSAGEEITTASAADAVEACHIALEVIGRCIGSADFQNGIGLTMDFAGNSVFVVGPEISNWQDQDLTNAPVTGKSDSEAVQTGSGANVLGTPINSLVWMAQTLAARGKQLKKGDWVSTGTCTPPVPAEAGKTISASFGDFGEVGARFV